MSPGVFSRTWADIRAQWRTPLAFHLVMQVLGIALFTPLATWLARRLVLASGEPVISNFDIAGFVLSPAGVAFVLVVAALGVALLLAEFAGHSWIAGHAIAGRRVPLASAVARVLRLLPALLVMSTRVFLRLVLLALPLLAVLGAVWFTTLAGHDVNYYLAERPPEWRRATLVIAALSACYLVVVVWQLSRWLFAVPILVSRPVSAAQALAQSARLTRDQLPGMLVPLAAWWLLLTGVAFGLAWAGRHLSDAGLDWAGIDVRRVLPLVAVYVAVSASWALLHGALWFTGHQFLVTRLYAERIGAVPLESPAEREHHERQARRVARPLLLAAPMLLLAAAAIAWRVAAQLEVHDDVAITAHRGASAGAPENTLAAFRAAIEAGATYAELDVQRTADGRLIVLHDGDLMRMGGDPRRVRDLTAAELQAIDVGRRYDARFAGEVPPTLEEVIALVRGRMKLNVELKYNVPDPDLAPAVIEVLKREDFLDQAVITSLDYAALRQVESLEPRLQTGHIVTAAVGNVTRSTADFLSLNSARTSTSLVRKAHAAGKGVHVWTVNRPEVMLRMIERGVDNIITDDPALLARVLEERRSLSRPELLGLRLRVLFEIPPREVTDPAAVKPL